MVRLYHAGDFWPYTRSAALFFDIFLGSAVPLAAYRAAAPWFHVEVKMIAVGLV